jgi:hypothetical protein
VVISARGAGTRETTVEWKTSFVVAGVPPAESKASQPTRLPLQCARRLANSKFESRIIKKFELCRLASRDLTRHKKFSKSSLLPLRARETNDFCSTLTQAYRNQRNIQNAKANAYRFHAPVTSAPRE